MLKDENNFKLCRRASRHSRLEDERGKGMPSEGSGGMMMPGKGCQKGHREPHSEEGLDKVLALIVKMVQRLARFLQPYFRIT